MEARDQLKQLKLSPATRRALKEHAQQRDIFLKQLYAQAVEWFLQSSAEAKSWDYLASPKEGKYTSIWLPHTSVKRIKARSAADNVAENRIIYTSIIRHLDKHQLVSDSHI